MKDSWKESEDARFAHHAIAGFVPKSARLSNTSNASNGTAALVMDLQGGSWEP